MLFDEITAKEEITTFKSIDNENIGIYIKPIVSNANENSKYQIYLEQIDGELYIQGYIYFYVDKINYQSQFIGIKIDPTFYNRKYASLLISKYIELCYKSYIYNLVTHDKQRKPEVVHILKKFGYETQLENDKDHESAIHIIFSKKNTLYIPNKALRRSLENSKLAIENNYSFIDSIENEQILDTIYYNHIYHLSNPAQSLKQRDNVKKQFSI